MGLHTMQYLYNFNVGCAGVGEIDGINGIIWNSDSI